MTLPISGLAAALSGLILVALAFRVSSLRMRHQVATGDGDIPALARAIRVHANSIEQMPIFLVQCLCYEANVGSTPLLAALVATFLLGRLAFAWSYSRAPIGLGRRLGAGVTYLTQLALGTTLLVHLLATMLHF
jgi:uncharacterized protein